MFNWGGVCFDEIEIFGMIDWWWNFVVVSEGMEVFSLFEMVVVCVDIENVNDG